MGLTACFGEAPVTGNGSDGTSGSTAGTGTTTVSTSGGESSVSTIADASGSLASSDSSPSTGDDPSDSTSAPDCEPPLDGLVAWWPFENDTTDRVAGITLDVESVQLDGDGRFGGSVRFNGVDAIGTAAASPALEVGDGDFSVEAWVNLDDLMQPVDFGRPVDFAVVTKMQSSDAMANADGWRLLMFAGDHHWWFCLGGAGNGCNPVGSTPNVARSTSVAAPAMWTHLVGVRAGTRVKIFVDGVLEDDVETTEPQSAAAEDIPLTVGATAFADVFQHHYPLLGRIDEVSIYDRALADDEVAALAGANRARCGS